MAAATPPPPGGSQLAAAAAAPPAKPVAAASAGGAGGGASLARQQGGEEGLIPARQGLRGPGRVVPYIKTNLPANLVVAMESNPQFPGSTPREAAGADREGARVLLMLGQGRVQQERALLVLGGAGSAGAGARWGLESASPTLPTPPLTHGRGNWRTPTSKSWLPPPLSCPLATYPPTPTLPTPLPHTHGRSNWKPPTSKSWLRRWRRHGGRRQRPTLPRPPPTLPSWLHWWRSWSWQSASWLLPRPTSSSAGSRSQGGHRRRRRPGPRVVQKKAASHSSRRGERAEPCATSATGVRASATATGCLPTSGPRLKGVGAQVAPGRAGALLRPRQRSRGRSLRRGISQSWLGSARRRRRGVAVRKGCRGRQRQVEIKGPSGIACSAPSPSPARHRRCCLGRMPRGLSPDTALSIAANPIGRASDVLCAALTTQMLP